MFDRDLFSPALHVNHNLVDVINVPCACGPLKTPANDARSGRLMLLLSCGRASRGTTAHLTTTGNALATSSGPHAHERLALSSVPEQRQARELEPREYRPPTTAVPDSDAAPRRRADISDDGGDGVRRVSTARVVVGIMIGTPGTVHGTSWHTARALLRPHAVRAAKAASHTPLRHFDACSRSSPFAEQWPLITQSSCAWGGRRLGRPRKEQ